MLAGDGVEHGLDDALHKPLLLVVIDLHHLTTKVLDGTQQTGRKKRVKEAEGEAKCSSAQRRQ